jgi:hypothetical protein
LLVASLGAAIGVLMAYKAVKLLIRATDSLSFQLAYWIRSAWQAKIAQKNCYWHCALAR